MKLVLLTEKTKSDLTVKEGRTTKCYARRFPKILVRSILTDLNVEETGFLGKINTFLDSKIVLY